MSREEKAILQERISEAVEVAENRYFKSGDFVGSIIDLTRLRIHLMGHAIQYGVECVQRGQWRSNYPYHRQDILEQLIRKRETHYREMLKKCTT